MAIIKRFEMNQKQLDHWMYQNRAEYMGDYVEGVLLDSFTLSVKRGYAAVYAHYLTPNSSDYVVEWQASPAALLWGRWEQFQAANEREEKENA